MSQISCGNTHTETLYSAEKETYKAEQLDISYRVNFGIPWFSFNLTAIKTVANVTRMTARTRKYLSHLGYLLNGCRVNNETTLLTSTCKYNKWLK